MQMELSWFLMVGPVLREPCSVDKVYVLPLGTPEFPLKICTECIVKKLVLEAVFGRTTHAQNSRVEANSFSVVYSYISCKNV